MNYCVLLLPMLMFGLFAYAIWSFWHTPKKEIDIKTRALIEQYGLKHFTRSAHIDSILENGIQPCPSRKMKNTEANLVWLYLNVDYTKHKKAISKKRKDYDTVIMLKNITSQQISNMRMRNDGAITFNGTLKTDCMIPFRIEEYDTSLYNGKQ